ncbi:MAG: regulatory protein RecX [Chloroflexota bacterium]
MTERRPSGARERDRPAPDVGSAVEIALHYLGARPRTRWELERRLRRTSASEEVIAGAMERLARLGYVDDTAFARWWAEQRDRHSPRGRRMVEAELRQRGVSREVLEAMRGSELSEPGLDDEILPDSEAERARTALDRHMKGRPLPDDFKALQRIGAFLMRRGFDPDTVRATLRAAGRGDSGES